MRSTESLDASMGELHTGPKYPLSGADTESYPWTTTKRRERLRVPGVV